MKEEDWLRFLVGNAGESDARVLLVYAHPDDEAIAVGGRLPYFADAHFVQVTDGAPHDNRDGERLEMSRDAYRETRRQEVLAAFHAGGITQPRHTCLGIADKEAALNLVALTQEIERILRGERVDAVFTHVYEGGHADHDACAFAVHHAVALLRNDSGHAPHIVESPFYHERNGELISQRFLEEVGSAEIICTLTHEERQRKAAMFAAFNTQAEVLRMFTLEDERYRIAPTYDFTRPPHDGPAYYERFMDGMSAARFCSLASDAQRLLQQELVCL